MSPRFLYFVYPGPCADFVGVSLSSAIQMSEHPQEVGVRFRIDRWRKVRGQYRFDRTVRKAKP